MGCFVLPGLKLHMAGLLESFKPLIKNILDANYGMATSWGSSVGDGKFDQFVKEMRELLNNFWDMLKDLEEDEEATITLECAGYKVCPREWLKQKEQFQWTA